MDVLRIYNGTLGPAKVVSEDGEEPVSLTEAKRHMNMSFQTSGSYQFNDDDAYITALIPMVRELIEDKVNMSLMDKTLEVEISGCAELPYGPVRNILGVTDENDEDLDYTYRAGKFISGRTYMKIRYTTGQDEIPKWAKLAILNEIAYRYKHRGDEVGEISTETMNLIRPYISWLY